MPNEALFTQGGTYDAAELRKLIRGVWSSPAPGGVLDGLVVTVAGALSISVSPGFAKIDDATSGAYLVYSTATSNVAISTNSGGGATRVDTVYAKVNDPGAGGTAGEMVIGVQTGSSAIPTLSIPLGTISVTTGNVLTYATGTRTFAEPRNPAGSGTYANLAERLTAIEAAATAASNVMVTLTGTQTVTNKDMTSATNIFPTGVVLPPGLIVPYSGTTAPAGWLLCAGQILPRTGVNAALFAVIGTTYGAGNADGLTFTLPDLRGRVVAASDNMGGTAANRLTGLALAAVRGAQSLTLDTTQLPAHSHPVTSVGDDSPDHAHSIPAHSHGGSTYGAGWHQHGMAVPAGSVSVAGGGANPVYRANLGGMLTDPVGDHGHGIPPEALGTYGADRRHSHTVTLGNTGSGAAVPTVQPTIALNYLIKL
jgi:microcystin-dependent protein